MITFFAHEGHEHAPTDDFFASLPGDILLNISPFVLLALLLALIAKLFRANTNWLTAFSLAYLLLVGLIGYSYVPVASTISIVVGFGLSLFLVVAPFKKVQN